MDTWFKDYGAPKKISSDEDVRFRSDASWYKRVFESRGGGVEHEVVEQYGGVVWSR